MHEWPVARVHLIHPDLLNPFSESMAAASAIWAAAERTKQIKGLILMGPFIRDTMPWGVASFLSMLLNPCIGPGFWSRWDSIQGHALYKVLEFLSDVLASPCSYYKSLYTKSPSTVPDLDPYVVKLKAHLASHPGRIRAVRDQASASR